MVDATPSEVLTTALIVEATGVDPEEHGLLDEIEIIFAPIKSVGGPESSVGEGLVKCVRLRRLSLIDCGLERIGSLLPVAATLERLCLADQRLTSMTCLNILPQLRELFLQQNAISKMEGLEECPRLRRVWLFSNRISRLEGVSANAELRELWLQENKLSRLGGLESQSQLRDLQVAGNRIADYRDLATLARLASLESISFSDAHFGCCPLASREGYRKAVLCALPSLRALDALEVTREERTVARDAQLEQVFEFNERVDALAREQRADAASIDARRRRTGAHAEALDAEMRSAFSQLEALVSEGRQAIVREHEDQRRSRELSVRALDASLTAALAAHSVGCDAALAREAARVQREDLALDALERRTRAERLLALLVAKLHYGDQEGSASPHATCQLLGEHSPDFKWLQSKLSNKRQQLTLLRAYRVCTNDGAEPASSRQQVFFCGSASDVEDLLHGRPQPSTLHPTAAEALATFLSEKKPASSEEYEDDCEEEEEGKLEAFSTAREAQRLLLPLEEEAPLNEAEDLLKDEDSLATAASGVLCLVVSCFAEGGCVVQPAASLTVSGVAAEHLLLVGSGLVAKDPRRVELDLLKEEEEDDDLAVLEERVSAELKRHRERVSEELDPVNADALRELNM